jgi:hypothetical protein
VASTVGISLEGAGFWSIAAGVVVVVVAISGAVLRYRSLRAATVRDGSIRIMVVGFAGAGKTLMMAGMYNELRLGGPEGVRLEADEGTTAKLREMILGMEHPDHELPAGNQLDDTVDYDFTFCVKAKDGSEVRPCGVRYLDYAGEWAVKLTQPGTDRPPPAEILEASENADVLMGILDGERMFEIMKGNPDPDFFTSLNNMMLLLLHARQRAVHLILTKWDRFEGEYEPKDVMERLDQAPTFKRFRSNPRPGVMRLIPVSSFGTNGYLSHDEAGMARKDAKSALHWQPYNVTSPIAFALKDVIDDNLRKAESRGRPRPARDFSPFFVAAMNKLRLIDVSVSLFPMAVTVKLQSDAGTRWQKMLAKPEHALSGQADERQLMQVLRYLDSLSELGDSYDLSVVRKPK